MRFSLYGNTGKTGPTIEDLELIANTDGLFARAEYSGSEGCHVEVCRWQAPKKPDDQRGHFTRYAFLKCFGGEDGDEKSTAVEAAHAIAVNLNAIARAELCPIIHRMPDWKE